MLLDAITLYIFHSTSFFSGGLISTGFCLVKHVSLDSIYPPCGFKNSKPLIWSQTKNISYAMHSLGYPPHRCLQRRYISERQGNFLHSGPISLFIFLLVILKNQSVIIGVVELEKKESDAPQSPSHVAVPVLGHLLVLNNRQEIPPKIGMRVIGSSKWKGSTFTVPEEK